MTVLDNIKVGRHHLLKNNFLTSSFYWLGGARKDEFAHRREIEDVVDFPDIQRIRNEIASELPDGLRERRL